MSFASPHSRAARFVAGPELVIFDGQGEATAIGSTLAGYRRALRTRAAIPGIAWVLALPAQEKL